MGENHLAEPSASSWFSELGFMPHGHCYLWDPGLMWTHLLSDLLIGFAYLGISITLYVLISRIKIPFSMVVICFGVFIGACGLTHFMEVWTLWNPNYWMAAFLKVITAIASVGTGSYLFRLRHKIVEFSNVAKLSEQRREALESLTQELDNMVHTRTAQLSSSELRFRTMVNSIPQLVWTCRPDGKCDYLSPQWVEFTGIPQEKQLDLEWLDRVIHPEDRARTFEHWMGAVEGKHPYDIEYRIRNKDGEYRWFKTRGTPVHDQSNRIVYWFGTCTDIEDQRRSREYLAHAVKLREDFLSIASHELKTPITALQMQIQILNRRIVRGDPQILTPGEISEVAAICRRQTSQLSRIIDDMLDVSRMATGKLSFEFLPMNFSQLIEQSCAIFANEFQSESIQLITQIEPGIMVFGDSFRLEQVVSNLLTNALKYGEQKPIEVTLSHTEDAAVLTVNDQGIGIKPEYLPKIFDKFERAIGHQNISGLGLGLFITREIVEGHRGRISVESELGRGSSFRVEIPMSKAKLTG